MEAPLGGSDRDKPNTSSSSPVSVISNFWKDFDLEKEKSLLDELGLKIAENQENSQKNRRKLAESTRDFKKASPEEKLSLFNSLLKGYQEEVDNLTKRAKFGENAFLNIYQKLYEAPDPYPALASIAEQDLKLSELESENRKMKIELEEYRTEATHLKNQQSTIRRLEERNRQLEQQMEEKVKEIVEIKQRGLAEENQKTLEILQEREQALQDQLRQAKDSVATMQKLHELAQSQLFEVRAQSDEERVAKQSEVNLLMDEVERAQTRLLSLQREKDLLRSQLQSANDEAGSRNRVPFLLELTIVSCGHSDTLDSNSYLENSLSAKEKIISELNSELHNIETALSNEREQHMNEIKKLNALLIEKEAALEDMKKELQARPTSKMVDDLRKKVKILQAVGYNSIEAEDWEVATNDEEMSKMESLLLDKNRKMEHELTQLKVKLSEKTSLLETAEGKIAELTAKINEQQKLIQKLEDDILKGYSSKDRKGNVFDDWDLSEAGGTELSEKADKKHTYPDQDQSSMLKVICNQRDRFRARLRETEEYAEDLESGFTSDIESKYKKMYEDDINPFAAFSKKVVELAQCLGELVILVAFTSAFCTICQVDRFNACFLLTRRMKSFVPSRKAFLIKLDPQHSKYARTFAFFYTILLHVLVFTCLYRMSALSYLSNGPEEFVEKTVDLPHAL
ncbi:protein CASP [Citrus sinensis]|uniref:Protein CASP n=1 Tax=Citrus sinensis TaxID=2711 RepID=A0ACB8LZ14_CITSI|nr:protein CASP [Citrus sinensis]